MYESCQYLFTQYKAHTHTRTHTHTHAHTHTHSLSLSSMPTTYTPHNLPCTLPVHKIPHHSYTVQSIFYTWTFPRTHARMHARTHARTETSPIYQNISHIHATQILLYAIYWPPTRWWLAQSIRHRCLTFFTSAMTPTPPPPFSPLILSSCQFSTRSDNNGDKYKHITALDNQRYRMLFPEVMVTRQSTTDKTRQKVRSLDRHFV